jgi:histone-lysine N-methyltransferase SUV39H
MISDAEGRTYLFDLDFNQGHNNPYTIYAAAYGNISHFINHSSDPNLHIFNVWINCLDPNLPRLCLFAGRDIAKGEQLTFNYCQDTTQNSGVK